MGWKNQLTKTPYLVLFIVLIAVGVGTASALITITLSGNVVITDDLDVGGQSTFHSSIIQERPSGNSDNFVIQRDGGAASDKPKFVLSQRSNNVQLWLFGNDGSTFKNFIGFDFPNYNVRIPANGDTLVVDAATDKVGVGTANPDSAIHVVGGGSDHTPHQQGIQLTGSDAAGNVGIELTGNSKTPYIDFQNDIDNTDFDARIALRGNDTLSIEGADLSLDGSLVGVETLDGLTCFEDQFARWNGTNWVCGTISFYPGVKGIVVDSDNASGTQSMTLTSDDKPVISYFDTSGNNPKILVCGDTNCSSGNTKRILESSANHVGSYNSLALTSNDYPVVSYYDSTDSALKVAVCADPTCFVRFLRTLDSAGIVGRFNSLAIASNDTPVIIYPDETNEVLKILYCKDIDCSGIITIDTIDSNSTGIYNSLALTSNDYPVVSYAANGGHLTIMTCVHVSCGIAPEFKILDTLIFEGHSSISLALTSDDRPVISYVENTNPGLKIFVCGDASCSSGNIVRTLDTDGNVPKDNSLTLTSDDRPVISYVDGTTLKLNVIICGDASCSSGNIVRTLETAVFGEMANTNASDVVMSSNGNPVMSYTLPNLGGVGLILCEEPTCITSPGDLLFD